MDYRATQAARILGISRATLYRMAKRGELRFSKSGGKQRIKHATLLRYARNLDLHHVVEALVNHAAGVLCVTRDATVAAALPRGCRWCKSWVELFKAAKDRKPLGVVLDLALGRKECVEAAMHFREEGERPTMIAVDRGESGARLWDVVLDYPVDSKRMKAACSACRRR